MGVMSNHWILRVKILSFYLVIDHSIIEKILSVDKIYKKKKNYVWNNINRFHLKNG